MSRLVSERQYIIFKSEQQYKMTIFIDDVRGRCMSHDVWEMIFSLSRSVSYAVLKGLSYSYELFWKIMIYGTG